MSASGLSFLRAVLFQASASSSIPRIVSTRVHLAVPRALRCRRLVSSADVAGVASDVPESLAPLPHHPWPEWVGFVDRLKSRGYFAAAASSENDDIYRDMKVLKDPCLSFARDRYDIFKSLPVKEIETIVEGGCPNLLRKVVNSAKRLRAYLQLDEGDVCSTCILRGSCDRAYVILKDSEAAAGTVDLVRVLLFYALDPLVTSGGEKPPGRVLAEASARKLLSELIKWSETSPDEDLPKPPTRVNPLKKQAENSDVDDLAQYVDMKRGDWMCPKCNFLNFAKNIRCLRCAEDGPRSMGTGVEMKSGDWICSECHFMNFARNLRCLQCKVEGPEKVDVTGVQKKKGDWNCPQCQFLNFASNKKCFRCQHQRPKRALNPGEWECPSCDFLNFRRNMVCLRCNCERPKDVEAVHEEHLWKRPV